MKIENPSNIYLVAPVQIIFPEDQIVAVILGFLSFINTFCKKRQPELQQPDYTVSVDFHTRFYSMWPFHV